MRKSLLGAALLSLSCSSVTDTGNPDRDDGSETGAGNCVNTPTPIELETVSALGFSAAHVIALAEGTHTETLAWLENEMVTSSGGDPSEVEVHLELGPNARFVDREPKQDDGGDTLEGDLGEPACNDRLELDATLTLKTADGLLDESVETVVWAETANLAHADFQIDADELAGSLSLSVEGPAGFEPDGPPQLRFDVRMAEVGFAGSIAVSASYSGDGGVAFGGGGPIAKWPDDNPCDFGFPVPVEQSQRVQEALTTFNGRGPLELEYEPETAASELSYALSATGEYVCEELDAASEGSVSFSGKLELTSDDGSIEVDLPVEVSTGPEGAETSWVNVAMYQTSETPEALLETLGIHQSVDFAGYDHGQVTVTAQVYGGTLTGALSVRGAEVPDCLTDPDPNGSGACQGTDYFDLWVARFSEPTNP